MAKVRIKNSPNFRKSKQKTAKKNDAKPKTAKDATKRNDDARKPAAKQTWYENLEAWERAELFSAAMGFVGCLILFVLWYAFGPRAK